jgi:hypothetical protein
MPLPFFPPTRRNRLVPEQNPRMSNMRSHPHHFLQALCARNLPTDALRNNIPTKTSQWALPFAHQISPCHRVRPPAPLSLRSP